MRVQIELKDGRQLVETVVDGSSALQRQPAGLFLWGRWRRRRWRRRWLWLLLFLGVTTPLISLSDGLWLLAAISVLPAVAATWLGWRALHQLSRRWLVFVPAGFVIHDPLLLGESILLRRTTVTSLGPANKSDLERGFDLSADAAGLSLKVVLTEPVDFARRKKRDLIVTEADVIVFNPTLPGAVLREARTRAITIEAATSS